MDWVLSTVVLLGNFLVGKKLKWGWIVLMINSLLWIYYALILSPPQYGLIPSASINFVLCTVNSIRWFREDRAVV